MRGGLMELKVRLQLGVRGRGPAEKGKEGDKAPCNSILVKEGVVRKAPEPKNRDLRRQEKSENM